MASFYDEIIGSVHWVTLGTFWRRRQTKPFDMKQVGQVK